MIDWSGITHALMRSRLHARLHRHATTTRYIEAVHWYEPCETQAPQRTTIGEWARWPEPPRCNHDTAPHSRAIKEVKTKTGSPE